jgi:DsbC/DsbD-like thiol-disulfide interchange protein
MTMYHVRVVIVTTALVASAIVVGYAQPGRPKAEVTPVVDEAHAQPGKTVRVSLNVSLPPDVHVQSDKPRDASLIPTVLTIDPPAGVTVAEIVYPTPTDLAQAGQKEPLAVFGPTFAIGVRLTLAKDLAAGEVTVPARLRYQACDARSCYPPARADAQWTISVTR